MILSTKSIQYQWIIRIQACKSQPLCTISGMRVFGPDIIDYSVTIIHKYAQSLWSLNMCRKFCIWRPHLYLQRVKCYLSINGLSRILTIQYIKYWLSVCVIAYSCIPIYSLQRKYLNFETIVAKLYFCKTFFSVVSF